MAESLPDGPELRFRVRGLAGNSGKGTPQPLSLSVRVSDGSELATGTAQLLVYQSDSPLVTPAWWKPGLPPVPWRAWLDHGVGFLVLWLIHLVGMSTLATWSGQAVKGRIEPDGGDGAVLVARRRFATYRILFRLSTLLSMSALGVWLWMAR